MVCHNGSFLSELPPVVLNWRFRNYVLLNPKSYSSLRVVVFCAAILFLLPKKKRHGSASWPVDLYKCFVIALISQVGLCQQASPVGGVTSWWSDAHLCWQVRHAQGLWRDVCVCAYVDADTQIYSGGRPNNVKKWAPLQLSRCYRSHSSDQRKLVKLTGFLEVFPENTVHLHK